MTHTGGTSKGVSQGEQLRVGMDVAGGGSPPGMRFPFKLKTRACLPERGLKMCLVCLSLK